LLIQKGLLRGENRSEILYTFSISQNCKIKRTPGGRCAFGQKFSPFLASEATVVFPAGPETAFDRRRLLEPGILHTTLF
jgi:hypothetical protein